MSTAGGADCPPQLSGAQPGLMFKVTGSQQLDQEHGGLAEPKRRSIKRSLHCNFKTLTSQSKLEL